MSDSEKIDAFFERLMADPNVAAAAVMLGPVRALEPSTLVQVLDSLAAHWAAACSEPVEAT